MDILIGCEASGRVRDAFIARGHNAVSCDLLPTAMPGPHIQGDVLQAVKSRAWDMLIAFPPYTYLSYAGMGNWYDPGRAMKRILAAQLFMELIESGIPKVCVENPRGIMSKIYRDYDQEIHPYYFGDTDMKRTCLWLRNLPPLNFRLQADLFGGATAQARPQPKSSYRRKKTGALKNRYFVDHIRANNPDRAHLRSVTFPAVARAMADQWG